MKLLNKFVMGSALALISSSVSAADIVVDNDISGLNKFYAFQNSGNNEMRSTQNGDLNRSFMYQTGSNLVANVRQDGTSNFAKSTQTGKNDVVQGRQSGDLNFAVVRQDDTGGNRRRVALYKQDGNNNRIVITQFNHPIAGDTNTQHQYSKSEQRGYKNKGHIVQYTAGSVSLYQRGWHNTARIQQTRHRGVSDTRYNRVEVSSVGGRNNVNVYQTGVFGGNSTVIAQNGWRNNAEVTQYGNRGSANITQNGHRNSVTLRQGGYRWDYTVVQTGNNMNAVVVQR
jgi:hypothetical protein